MCMYNKITYARTCAYKIKYYVVWTVKRRHKVLTLELENFLIDEINRIASEKGFTVIDCSIMDQDQVHCVISAPPKLSITDIVRYLKGISGKRIIDKYPEIKKSLWKGEIWNHSYFVETIGDVSDNDVLDYIERQTRTY